MSVAFTLVSETIIVFLSFLSHPVDAIVVLLQLMIVFVIVIFFVLQSLTKLMFQLIPSAFEFCLNFLCLLVVCLNHSLTLIMNVR